MIPLGLPVRDLAARLGDYPNGDSIRAAHDYWAEHAPRTPGALPWLSALLDMLDDVFTTLELPLPWKECECMCHHLSDGLGMSHAKDCCDRAGQRRAGLSQL